jgi:hypothetical protein
MSCRACLPHPTDVLTILTDLPSFLDKKDVYPWKESTKSRFLFAVTFF